MSVCVCVCVLCECVFCECCVCDLIHIKLHNFNEVSFEVGFEGDGVCCE